MARNLVAGLPTLVSRPEYPRPNSMQVFDTRLIRGLMTGPFVDPRYGSVHPVLPLCGSVATRIEEDAEETDWQLLDALGFDPDPQHEIFVGADCNDPTSHRILAEIAAYLAEELDAVVDFGAKLERPLPGRVATLHFEPAWWDDQLAELSALDAVAIRAWSREPNCWMPK